jgi:DNA-binding NarL/FixJ family response regulator
MSACVDPLQTIETTSERRVELMNREMEVLRLLAEGLEQDEIARQLFITRKTVGTHIDTHIENVMRKLGVRTRSQDVALAYREDLIKTTA